MGDVDIAKAQALLATRGGLDKISMEANGWLLGAFAGNARRSGGARGDRAPRDEQRQRDRGRRELHDRATATARTCCSPAIAASTA